MFIKRLRFSSNRSAAGRFTSHRLDSSWRIVACCLFIAGFFTSMTAFALDSDREQPATLDADDFELDFNTGVRIYRGNVIYRQGTIRLNCDELTTYFNKHHELDKAICIGTPGRFRQLPEGSENDVFGKGSKIVFDQAKEEVLITGRAKVTQDKNVLTGRLITYDLIKQRVRVKGSSSTAKSSSKKGTSSRPRLVIQPRKKKQQ
jgi:lipopolysaccharide export system protein LptA